MSRFYCYRVTSLSAAYARGAAGMALTAGPAWLLDPARPVFWTLAAASALFLVYFGRAVVRHLTQIELSETGIAARGPFGAAIAWDELRSLKLSHYTTRSDRTGGWMQLDLSARRRSICVDSSLGNFAELAGLAAREALRRGQRLDDRTRSNLSALGVRLQGNA